MELRYNFCLIIQNEIENRGDVYYSESIQETIEGQVGARSKVEEKIL